MSDEQLTASFNLSEFLTSPGAAYYYQTLPINIQHQVFTNISNLAHRLQAVRDILACPITITSGLRTKEHNAVLHGAVSDSTHLDGRGADWVISEEYINKARVLLNNWSGGYHWYPEDRHFHTDTRDGKFRW